jgi:hypothetical protein
LDWPVSLLPMNVVKSAMAQLQTKSAIIAEQEERTPFGALTVI